MDTRGYPECMYAQDVYDLCNVFTCFTDVFDYTNIWIGRCTSIPVASAAETSKCPGHCEFAQIYRRRVFSTSYSSNGFVQIPLRLWFALKGR